MRKEIEGAHDKVSVIPTYDCRLIGFEFGRCFRIRWGSEVGHAVNIHVAQGHLLKHNIIHVSVLVCFISDAAHYSLEDTCAKARE
jgi:hypothetical protein